MSNPIDMSRKDYNGPGTGYYDDLSNSDVASYWNQLYQNTNDQPMNIFDSWFNSEATANRDFARQMMGQMYQNWYESAPEQMKRLKEAGINPITAAASIAGSSAGASPMSAPQTDAQNPLSEIAGIANAVSGGLKNATGALKDYAESTEVAKLLPWKAISLQTGILKDLSSIGLQDAEAQSICIANQYDPVRFQLGIAKARLELPILVQQEKGLRAEYERTMTEIDKMESDMRVNDASISLMEKQGFNQLMQAKRAEAEKNYTSQRFQMLRDMNWDPATGIEGLFGSRLADPKYTVDDIVSLSDNLTSWTYNMARYKFLGDNNLPLEEGRSLFGLETDRDVNTSFGVRKDIPSTIKVGPFETSTNLRDFFHQKNNNNRNGNYRFGGSYNPHYHK